MKATTAFAVLLFCVINTFADSSSFSSASSSSSQNTTQESHSENSSSMSFKTYNNDEFVEFNMVNNIGNLHFKNLNEECSFQNKPLRKSGNTFYFEDKTNQCKITIKIKSNTVVAKSNGKPCVTAKYCTNNKAE